jgi:hypothetical protein
VSVQQRFDGFQVTVYEGRFNGGFDITEEEAHLAGLDGLAIFVVAARVGRAQFETLKSGDLRRRNVYLVTDARLLTDKLRDQAINYLAFFGEGALDFAPQEEPPVTDEAPLVVADVSSNGEDAEQIEPPYRPPDDTVEEVVQVGVVPHVHDEVLRKFLEQP